MKLESTNEDIAFLNSTTAVKIRQMLSIQAKVQSDALIQAAMESTDPKVRGIATSLATFRETLKALQPPKETTDE
jgi:hypothetical protein